MIGHRLGLYNIVEKLGESGIGTVYREFDAIPGRELASGVVGKDVLQLKTAYQLGARSDL